MIFTLLQKTATPFHGIPNKKTKQRKNMIFSIFRKKTHPIKYLILATAIFFYFYEFFLRVFPSILVEDLILIFHTEAKVIGLMSAFYVFAYAPMQLPIGLLMDRFGARKLLVFASFICAIGSIIFGMATDIFIASVARFFLGFGSAFAFIGMIYIITHSFPKKRHGLLIGLGNGLGMLGGIIGEGPINILVEKIGWRDVSLLIFGGLGIIIGILFFFIIKKEKKINPEKTKKRTIHDFQIYLLFKKVIKNPQTWVMAIISLCTYITTSSFAGLWGVSFFKLTYPNNLQLASFAPSAIFLGWIIGGPIIGSLFQSHEKSKSYIRYASLIASILMLMVIYLYNAPILLTFIMLFFIGIFSTAQLFTYMLAIDANSILAKGSSIAIVNFMVWIGGAIAQPLVGLILDFTKNSNLPIYTIANYQSALLCFPIAFFGAFILSFFIKKAT
jgi:MFS family permease